jgi:hypothetical protein
VFGDGDDAPLLVRIPPPLPPKPTQALASTDGKDTTPTDRPPLHWGCACTGENYAAVECATTSDLVEQDEIQQGIVRIATGALQATSLDELNSFELLEAIRRESATATREQLMIGCLAARGAEWLAEVWGGRRTWPFSRTHELAEELRRLLADALGEPPQDPSASSATDSLATYQRVSRELLGRTTNPYPGCSTICTGDLADYCLYRDAAAATLQRADMVDVWNDARTRESPDVEGYPRTWATCLDTIAPEILGPGAQQAPSQAAALCFAQQAVAAESPSWPPWAREQFVWDLITMASEEQTLEEDVVETTAPGPSDEQTKEEAP